MESIFVSTSGESDREFIASIAAELYGQFSVIHQGSFRGPDPDVVVAAAHHLQPHQLLHFHWCEHLTYTRGAQVMVVLFTGEEKKADGRRGLSEGMTVEVLDVIWRATPVVWVATSELGLHAASFHHWQYRRSYPFIVSHLVSAIGGERLAGVRRVADLCVELARIPRPELPTHVSAGKACRVEYQLCRATEGGWEQVRLARTSYEPHVLLSYGHHIINSPYWSPPKCERSVHDFVGKLDYGIGGSTVGCRVVPPRRGYGTMHLRWANEKGHAVDHPNVGSSMLSWDFVCDFDWLGF